MDNKELTPGYQIVGKRIFHKLLIQISYFSLPNPIGPIITVEQHFPVVTGNKAAVLILRDSLLL